MKLSARTLAAWGLLSLGLLAGAQTTSEKLQQLQRDLQEQKQLNDEQARKLESLRKTLDNLTAQQKATLNRLDTLALSVADLENQLAEATARVALAERQLDDITAQLTLTQTRLETLKTDVRGLLDSLYRERNGYYLALLTQARSLSDLLIRLDYANMAGTQNTRVITLLRDTATQLQDQQARQTQQAQSLRQLQAARTQKLTELRQKRSEQQQLLAQLRQSAEGQRAIAVRTQAQQALTAQSIDTLVGQVIKERSRIEAERKRRLEQERQRRAEEARRIAAEQERARQEAIRLAKLRAEQERRAREVALERQRQETLARERAALQARQAALAREQAALRARQNQVRQDETQAAQQLKPLSSVSRGPVAFPLPGGRVATPFGENGAQWVLLSAPSGTQATAALEGNVLAATYYASLGWVVLLDNGSGIVTGYFGLQNAAVSVGDRVAKGSPVGMIGGSPVFGTDRMAFQLRENGLPVAPRF